MSDVNPYQAPEASVAVEDNSEYQPKIFALNGRIGRLRYLAYAFGVTLLMYLIMFVVMGASGMAAFMTPDEVPDVMFSGVVGVILILIYVVVLVYAIILMRRRLNDLNRSGWFALIVFIPIINFFLMIYLIFFAGTAGGNDFGPAPTQNSLGVKILGIVLPLIFLVGGILAAIAIPSYQDYVDRANAAQQQ